MIKSTAIDPSVVDPDGVYRKTGPARVFTREREAIAAIKGQGERPIRPGDVLVLIGRGPIGAGMEEIYQITSALRYLSFGKQVAVLDRRPVLGRFDRRVRRPRQSGGAGRRADRQAPRRRPDPDRRRPCQARRIARPGRRRGVEFGPEEEPASSTADRPTRSSRPTPTCPTTPGSGRPSERRRWHLGRVRLRHGRDHQAASSERRD